jgi:putative ABC transport system permease protein
VRLSPPRRRLRPLTRKLLRDLAGMRGQALAIGLVVAAGVAMFTAYLSNFDSLRRSENRFYERQRFADVFAPLLRAPQSLAVRLEALPGVEIAETRVVADVTLDVPRLTAPASGRLVSIPDEGRPRLNDLHLRAGRWPDPSRPDEVLASEAFAAANRLAPGARLAALVNGRQRRLRLSGVALSPEYVYSIRPGELIPDDRHFGVLWMQRRALAAAFDLEGAFNDVTLRLVRGASLDEAIASVDRLLEPYGGRGAIPRSQQLSAWMLGSELKQLASFGVILPGIFFAVAAFVLNIALARALSLQRAQVATLKALGYSNRAIASHYRGWALAVTGAGAVLGVAAGAWLGAAIARMYNEYFKFPDLDYRVSPVVATAAVAIALATAVLGARRAVARAVAVPPAEAMRPEPPARFRKLSVETTALGRRLTQGARIVVRNLARQPGRAATSVLGIALGGAIVFVGLTFLDSIERIIATEFHIAQRQDATLSLTQPRAAPVLHEIARLPGVVAVEPFRSVGARLVAGHRHRIAALQGIPAASRLQRLTTRHGEVPRRPPAGLVLSRRLGELLAVRAGDDLTVEVLEGRRPRRTMRVAALLDDTMGLAAWMDLAQLNRLLGEGPTISGAHLELDAAGRQRFDRAVKTTPVILGVAFLDRALQGFRATLAEHLWITLTTIVGFASIIASGVVYNAARVALSERSRELASLRVLGFTHAEISFVLLGELASLIVVALPLSGILGWSLAKFTMALFDSDVYRIPLVLDPATLAWSFLVVVGAALGSSLVVRHRLDHLDLIAVLKTSE